MTAKAILFSLVLLVIPAMTLTSQGWVDKGEYEEMDFNGEGIRDVKLDTSAGIFYVQTSSALYNLDLETGAQLKKDNIVCQNISSDCKTVCQMDVDLDTTGYILNYDFNCLVYDIVNFELIDSVKFNHLSHHIGYAGINLISNYFDYSISNNELFSYLNHRNYMTHQYETIRQLLGKMQIIIEDSTINSLNSYIKQFIKNKNIMIFNTVYESSQYGGFYYHYEKNEVKNSFVIMDKGETKIIHHDDYYYDNNAIDSQLDLDYDPVKTFCISSDDRSIFGITDSNYFYQWNIESGRAISKVSLQDLNINAIKSTINNKILLASDIRNGIFILHVPSLQYMKQLIPYPCNYFIPIKDEKFIAVAGVKIYRINVKMNNSTDEIFSLYPNPTSGELYINTLVEFREQVQLEIISQLGEVIKRFDNVRPDILNSSAPLDLSGLAPGMYFLRISWGEVKETKSFILKK